MYQSNLNYQNSIKQEDEENGHTSVDNSAEIIKKLLLKEQESIICSLRWFLFFELIIQMAYFNEQPGNTTIIWILIGTILFSFCITFCAKCMIKSHCGIIFVVICVSQLIYYMYVSLSIIILGYKLVDIVLELTTVIIVLNFLSKCYQLYKLNKPSNVKEDSGINKNLLDEQNSASYPSQVIQQPVQVMQPPLQYQPIINNVNPNQGYYPGPPMSTAYDNYYVNQNKSGNNI